MCGVYSCINRDPVSSITQIPALKMQTLVVLVRLRGKRRQCVAS